MSEIQAVFTQLSAEATGKAGFDAYVKLFSSAAPSVGNTVVVELVDKLVAACDDKAVPARAAAVTAMTSILEGFAGDKKALDSYVGKFFLATSLAVYTRYVFRLLGDKKKEVSTPAARGTAAVHKLRSMLANSEIEAIVLPVLRASLIDTEFNAWQIRVEALNFIEAIAKEAKTSEIASRSIISLIEPLAELMNHVKPQVQTAARATMDAVVGTVGNRDLDPFLPNVVLSVADFNEVGNCIHRLAATTFVQEVEAPALAILVPTLVRGLRDPTTAIKRKAAVIIDNMSKLVEQASQAAPFLPMLLPEIAKNAEEVADPEVRKTTEKALVTLKTIEKEVEEEKERFHVLTHEEVVHEINAVYAEVTSNVNADLVKGVVGERVAASVAAVVEGLITYHDVSADGWKRAQVPELLAVLSKTDGEALFTALLTKCAAKATGGNFSKFGGDDVEDEGEDLCRCVFSLAYGAKILLSQATLHLKRGKRYALCGPNGAGKSTLMRAIVNDQVEGFPSPDVVRTVYVEHDIQSDEDLERKVIDFVKDDERVKKLATPEEVRAMLSSVGFSDAMIEGGIGALSGGWKMKLALARAVLLRADILLLDEPTNHLDVTNVKWLEDYLCSLTNVTSIIVSHDSGFIDRVCTNVIHYEGRKLRTYRGNLSALIKIRPEAKSYYTLEAQNLFFKFPEPGILDGVKSKDRAILKMRNVSFGYPGTNRTVVHDASLFVALASRIAVVGPNGAGKSTLIKILTGEMEPTSGTLWKHPNLRIAYVAQHAFHHIEQHLDKTPSEYIQWRFAFGEDREALEKVDRKIDEEEQKKMRAQVHVVDGEKRKVDRLLGRRKARGTYEYEVAWQGMIPSPDNNTWMTREDLELMGLAKLCTDIDMKEAAAAGLTLRPLTSGNIAKHLEDVGLEEEFTLHAHIRGLSGGQKVKVVIGAAMWMNPHILVLDEPTNYLDRDSLGALAGAIKEYGGGVVLISHHSEFTDHLCREQWVMSNGYLTVKGEVPVAGKGEKIDAPKEGDTMIDGFGNEVKISAPKKKLSRREALNAKRLAKLSGTVGDDDD